MLFNFSAHSCNVYERFFAGTLPIGKHGPIYEEGFATVEELKKQTPFEPSSYDSEDF